MLCLLNPMIAVNFRYTAFDQPFKYEFLHSLNLLICFRYSQLSFSHYK